MKTIKSTLLLIAVVLSTLTYAQKTVKIGHINSNDLLTAMPERETVQKQIEDHAMRKEYETKVGEFQAKQEVMTDIIRDNKIKEITDLEKRITEFQKTAQADLQKKEETLLQPIIDKAKKAIDDVAKENNFTYILDSSLGVILYSVDSDDILPLVKKKLNIQ
jgi:outer membrane protein